MASRIPEGFEAQHGAAMVDCKRCGESFSYRSIEANGIDWLVGHPCKPKALGVNELVFASPSMGRVTLVASPSSGSGYRSLAAIEKKLASLAGSSRREDLGGSFYLTPSDYEAVEDEMTKLLAFAPITEPGNLPVPIIGTVGMLCGTAGRVRGAYLQCGMAQGHEGECDWRARKLTDDQLASELSRRHAGGAYLMLEGCTDAQLRAECTKRRIDTMTPDITAAWAKDREEYLKNSLAHSTDAQLRAEVVRRRSAGGWKSALECASDGDLRTEVERRNPPRYKGARVGEIIAAIAACLDKADTDGACDVLDREYLNQEMEIPRKLAADVRGLVVAAYNFGREAPPVRVVGLRGGKKHEMTQEVLERLTDEQLKGEIKRRGPDQLFMNALECASEDQLRAECGRRGMTALGLAQWSDEMLRAECEKRFTGPVNEYTRLAAEHRELKKELETSKASNVAAIRAAKVARLHPRLREVRPNTMGEVWQQIALGEVPLEKLVGHGHKTEAEAYAWFRNEFGVESLPFILAARRLGWARRQSEGGAGIASAYQRHPKHVQADDLATSADLLADDDDGTPLKSTR